MTYSIIYERPENTNPYETSAIDWNWRIKGKWARSEKEGPGHKWYKCPGLDKPAYHALMKHFGLDDEVPLENIVSIFGLDDELSLRSIVSMSPDKLGEIRRKKEKTFNLPRKEIASDTMGDHRVIP